MTRLRNEKSVLVVPGDHFGMDGYLRLGFGERPDYLRQGLERLHALLELRSAPRMPEPELALALVGFGNVARRFVRLLDEAAERLEFHWRLVAIGTRHHGSVVDPDGIDARRAVAMRRGRADRSIASIRRAQAAAASTWSGR